MHGRGRFEWAASGEVYNGHWVKGKMTGEGIKVQSDGCRLQGSFLGGELNGWGEKVRTKIHVFCPKFAICNLQTHPLYPTRTSPEAIDMLVISK